MSDLLLHDLDGNGKCRACKVSTFSGDQEECPKRLRQALEETRHALNLARAAQVDAATSGTDVEAVAFIASYLLAAHVTAAGGLDDYTRSHVDECVILAHALLDVAAEVAR